MHDHKFNVFLISNLLLPMKTENSRRVAKSESANATQTGHNSPTRRVFQRMLPTDNFVLDLRFLNIEKCLHYSVVISVEDFFNRCLYLRLVSENSRRVGRPVCVGPET